MDAFPAAGVSFAEAQLRWAVLGVRNEDVAVQRKACYVGNKYLREALSIKQPVRYPEPTERELLHEYKFKDVICCAL